MTTFLRSLAKLAALVIVAGGVGVAIGMGLATLSDGDEPAAPDEGAATSAPTEPPAATSTQTTTAVPAATATVPPVTTTTTSPSTASGRLAQVRVSVLGTRLFTDSTPSGREAQPARVTVRLRAENRGDERVRLKRPTLRVGSVRIPADAGGGQFAPLGPGADATVTLRFSLTGEATPKVVRDRRARITVAGRSLPIRVSVQHPRGRAQPQPATDRRRPATPR